MATTETTDQPTTDDDTPVGEPFYLVLECPFCGEDMCHGLVVCTDTHNGYMAVPITVVEQLRFYCGDCDKYFDTGELIVAQA